MREIIGRNLIIIQIFTVSHWLYVEAAFSTLSSERYIRINVSSIRAYINGSCFSKGCHTDKQVKHKHIISEWTRLTNIELTSRYCSHFRCFGRSSSIKCWTIFFIFQDWLAFLESSNLFLIYFENFIGRLWLYIFCKKTRVERSWK